MSSNSIYTIPYTYLIGWSSLDLYYYGRRTAQGCNPSDLFESYFTSSNEVKSYILEYGHPDIVQIRRTFDSVSECCEWECTVLRRLDAKNHPRFLNKTNGDSEWIYSGVDAIWMNRNGKNRRIRREHMENYQDMGWNEGRQVDWTWIKKDESSKRVSLDEVEGYLENGWKIGRVIDNAGEKNGMYGRRGKDSFNFRGYWYTPYGTFETLTEAVNTCPIKTSAAAIHNLCNNNDRIISKISYERNKILQCLFVKEHCVNKSLKDLGFGHK